jgi:glycosyltransferase involved in cell wall biosynthesis
MKVLVISNGYPDFKGSYRGIFIQRLCKELKKQELDIVVVTPKVFKESPFFQDDEGIKVYRFWYPSKNQPLGQSGKIPIFGMIIYMIFGFFKSLRVIMKEKPDIIHGNWIVPTGLIAALAGFITRIPVINTAHGMDLRIADKPGINILFGIATMLSKRITIVSENMKQKRGLEEAEVIPLGVDDVFFNVNRKENGKTVISTRSLESLYDVETLIRAVPLVLEKIFDARFIILGTGSQDEYLKQLAQSLNVGDKVDFIGSVPNTEIARFMSEATVYVSTSLADGTSVSLLEALSAGLIPVVTDIDANRTWVTQNKEGFLFKPKDEADLAENITGALDGSIDDHILINKRQQMKNKTSWSYIAEQHRILYNKVILGC